MTRPTLHALDPDPTIGDRPPVAGQAFRDAIARVPSAVHVITTDGPAGRGGFTATAFASVSDDPPTVLVCLNQKSSQSAIFRENRRFAVNLMPAGSSPIADVFAGRNGIAGADRFGAGTWTTLVTGAPALETAVATLDCLLTDIALVGTHAVMFGRVVGVADRPAGPGGTLIYRDRGYAEA